MTDESVGQRVGGVMRSLWWLVLLRGVLAVIFGIVAIALPGDTLLALAIVFGVYTVVDGLTAIVLGIRYRAVIPHWGWQLFQGVLSVLAGIVAIAWPGITLLAILLVIAFWTVLHGIMMITEALVARRALDGASWGWLLAGGVLSVLLGIALFVQPGAGLVALLWTVGIFSVVFGIVLVVGAFRLRKGVGTLMGR